MVEELMDRLTAIGVIIKGCVSPNGNEYVISVSASEESLLFWA